MKPFLVTVLIGASFATTAIAQSECLSDPEVLEAIQKRQADLDGKEKALAERELDLKKRSDVIEEELKKLEALRQEISLLDTEVQKKNQEKVEKLVGTFESMSPKSAAQVLAGIDDRLAVQAMTQLSNQKLGKVLAAMDSARSARLTELMAGVVRAKSQEATQKQ